MQRYQKRQKTNSSEADNLANHNHSVAAPADKPAVVKKVWHLNLEMIRAAFPDRPQDVIPDLDDIFALLASASENTRPILPGLYIVDDETDLQLDCHVIVRYDRYNRMKIDLFSQKTHFANGAKTILSTVTTINCIDVENKKFSIKPFIKYIAKDLSLSFEMTPAVVEKYAETYAENDDPSYVTNFITTEVNNLRATGLIKVKGPYFKATTGANAGIHGFFTMAKVEGEELFYRIHKNHFTSYEKLFEVMLRCLHAVDKQVVQHGKFHLDLKPENFMSLDYGMRTQVAVIDGESMHDNSASFATRRLGTHGYSAPELVKEKLISQSSDVYSLGMMFRVLCGDMRARYFTSSKLTDKLVERMEAELNKYGYIRSDYHLLGIPHLNDVLTRLFDWLLSMTQAQASLRCHYLDCMAKFETIYTQFRMQRIHGIDDNQRTAIRVGIDHGFKFASCYRAASIQKVGLRDKEFRKYTDDLAQIAAAARAEKGEFHEFFLVVDDLHLLGCTDYQNLLDRIFNISDKLTNALTAWNKLGKEIEMIEDRASLKFEYDIFFKEVIAETPLTLTDLYKLAEHISKKERSMRTKFTPSPQQIAYAKQENKSGVTEEESPSKKLRK